MDTQTNTASPAGQRRAERFTVSGSFADGEITVAALPATMISEDNVITLPAGRYFVGDPCYTAGSNDRAWMEWCDLSYSKSPSGEVLYATYNGLPVVGLHTAYGDGSYYDWDGREYGVDAGIIGAVPEELVEALGLTEEDLHRSGHWIETTEPFVLRQEGAGVLFIGGVRIDTDPSDDEEDLGYDDGSLDYDESNEIGDQDY